MGCKECRLTRESKTIVYHSRKIDTVEFPSEKQKTDRLNISIDEQVRRVHPRRKQLVADVDDYPDVPNLDNLPVELLYYLFDRLDASTIVTSLYNVCQRLNTIVTTYDQYHLNLKSISINHFHQMCSIIRPEQVVALTLSDGNENVGLVKLFLKKFRLESFERLKTLNLINIDHNERMTRICLGINDQLQQLHIENNRKEYNDTVIDVLLSIIGKPNLKSLVLDLGRMRPWSAPLIWSSECSLRKLRFINRCSLTLLRNILISSPNLEIFEASDIDFSGEWPHQNLDSDEDDEEIEHHNPSLLQNILYADRLKSLALISAHNEMKVLQWFLPQFTQLTYLKYINRDDFHLNSIFDEDMATFDGRCWQKAVEHCEKFEFILGSNLDEDSLWNSHEVISTFQTEFWQKKNWLTGLEEYENLAVIYSIPYPHHSNYFGKLKFVSMPNNQSLSSKSMENVTKLRISISIVKNLQKTITGPIRFPHVSHLILDDRWDEVISTSNVSESIQSLQNLVNLSKIIKLIRFEPIPSAIFQCLLSKLSQLQSLTLTTLLLDSLNPTTFRYLQSLSSLTVVRLSFNDPQYINVNAFCSMFPYVQHLDIPVDKLDNCQIVVDRLKMNLISIVFRFSRDEDEYDNDDDDDEEQTDFHRKLVRWARYVRHDHKYRVQDGDIYLWLSTR